MPKSEKHDNELTLYQLHSRYCCLYGLGIKRGAELWETKFNKGLDYSRDEHLSRLLVLLEEEIKKDYAKNDMPYLAGKFFMEGEEYIKEFTQRRRNSTIVQNRLEKDNYTCQHCGFSVDSISIADLEIDAVIVEVHHIKPLQEGKRESSIDDLITLCPTCHRLIHAIGKQIDDKDLSVNLLSQYYPISKI